MDRRTDLQEGRSEVPNGPWPLQIYLHKPILTPSILLFRNEFNKFNNTGARMLDSLLSYDIMYYLSYDIAVLILT